MPAVADRRRRWLLAGLALVTLSAFAVLAVDVDHGSRFLGHDGRVRHWLMRWGSFHSADWLMSHTRNAPAYVLILGIAGVITARARGPRLGLAVALGPLIAWLATEHVLKQLIDRPWHAFPSGHTAAAASCALAFALAAAPRSLWLRGLLGSIGLGAVAVIGWAATASYAHDPVDVLGGLLFGVGIAAGACALAGSDRAGSDWNSARVVG